MKKMIYLKLIFWGVCLTFLISLFSAAAVILHLKTKGSILLQITAFLLAAIILTCFMKRKDPKMSAFGFRLRPISKKLYLFIGLIVLVQPLVLGFDTSLSISTIFLVLLQMILVGYVEEGLFRGIYFYYLKQKSPLCIILFSSFTFGILHFASSLNPDMSKGLVFLQIGNAVLLGLVFSLLYYFTQTIYLVVLFHALFNIFASLSATGSFTQNVIAVAILMVFYLAFLLFFMHSYLRRNYK